MDIIQLHCFGGENLSKAIYFEADFWGRDVTGYISYKID